MRLTSSTSYRTAALVIAFCTTLCAQQSPYDVFPDADAPYYRVRYDASNEPGELTFAVNYTVWIPSNVKTLRGVVVHQHGCGEGSCKSGLTGAYDLHWQALAKKHDCALLAPSYEQPEGADCQMWCDPRNGSDAAFQNCLVDLGKLSGHPELASVPWALWGHSGGGHWAGGMVMLHPERVVAAWLRSGVPLLKPNDARSDIKVHKLPDAALRVPMMCNFGTKEGVTVKDGRFSGVWPANEIFFNEVRGMGGLIGVAIDPLTAHECGNQRYFAIPWLDACLTSRLPNANNKPLKPMPRDDAWLAGPTGLESSPAKKFDGDPRKAGWLPNESIARAWMQYVKDTAVPDQTPPPSPTNLQVEGNQLSWQAEADLESGLAYFAIHRDGKFLANVPKDGKNPFGRPIFQNLQYSDTPTQPLVPMRFVDSTANPDREHTYRVIAVNTVGLKSNVGQPAQPVPFKHAGVVKAWETSGNRLTFGKGQTLALVDDGCNLSMPEWSKSDGDQPKVLVTYDSVDGDDDPMHEGRGYHGSTIGIPSSVNYGGKWGVAYNNQVAVIRALECCHCDVSDSKTVATGLQWIIDNHKKYRITTVNLAPVDDKEHNVPVQSAIDEKLVRLRELGIWVSAPTGNHNFTSGISWPACQPKCYAIGAVRLGKDEVCLDRHAKVDLVVPAVATSSSNAIATGAAMVLREAIEETAYDWKKDALNLPDAIMSIMQKTGVTVEDATTRRSYQRLDLAAAIAHVYASAKRSTAAETSSLTPNVAAMNYAGGEMKAAEWQTVSMNRRHPNGAVIGHRSP
ncbi:MAG: S8/S53 family peptidase [Planctomycetales bacterium]|nr:S8/S53 family peptidase [Planctomycetales bacterium]